MGAGRGHGVAVQLKSVLKANLFQSKKLKYVATAFKLCFEFQMRSYNMAAVPQSRDRDAPSWPSAPFGLRSDTARHQLLATGIPNRKDVAGGLLRPSTR